jgi:hypothetical protein
MIFADALPKIKTFLRPARLAASTCDLLARFVAASLCHPGRMSCSQAAQAIRSQARHRAQLARFLARARWAKGWAVLTAVADLLLAQGAKQGGTWLFLLDQTHVGRQGQHTENTFRRGNYKKRPAKSGRKQKKYARRSCHGLVCGLLITPAGLRIPSCRCYYTRGYCKARGLTYQKQPQLAAELIQQVAVPAGARVVVLGDTAFEAKDSRAACGARLFVGGAAQPRAGAGRRPAPAQGPLAARPSFCRALRGRPTDPGPGRLRRARAGGALPGGSQSQGTHLLGAPGEAGRPQRGRGAARLFDQGTTASGPSGARAEGAEDRRRSVDGGRGGGAVRGALAGRGGPSRLHLKQEVGRRRADRLSSM